MSCSGPYTIIGVFAILAVLFGGVPLIIAKLISPNSPGKEKQRVYECGTVEGGDPWGQFRVQFYFYALIFVVFDIEALFLYPWAVIFRDVGFLGFLEMLVFITLLGLGWIYAWHERVLEWE